MCLKRWTESAEEASSGAELVVEAILEDLQVRSFEALVEIVVVAVDGGGVVVVAILEDLQVRSFEVLVVDDCDGVDGGYPGEQFGILDVLVVVVPENICQSKTD